MKKLFILIVIVLSFALSFLTRTAFADNNYCWVSTSRGVCDAVSHGASKCPDNMIKQLQDVGYRVYETQDDCKKDKNQLFLPTPTLPPTPTATPTPDPNATPTPTPDPLARGANANNAAYTLDPVFEAITDSTKVVGITFNNIETSDPVYVCLEDDLCIDNDNIRNGIANGDADALAKATRMTLSDVDEATLMRYKLGPGNKIDVCGDGSTKLKADGDSNNHPYYSGRKGAPNGDWWKKMEDQKKAGCQDDRDYFQPGKVYFATTFTKINDLDGEGHEGWALGTVAGFYVNHKSPRIEVNPITNIQPGAVFEVKISMDEGDLRANGIKDGKPNPDWSDRNNYQILIEGAGLSTRACGYLGPNGKDKGVLSKTFSLPTVQPGTKSSLQPGPLKILISEQASEESLVKQAIKHPLDFTDNFADVGFELRGLNPYIVSADTSVAAVVCKGGFIYRQYNCTVSTDTKINNCKLYRNYNPKTGKEELHEYLEDPNKSDVTGLLAYFDRLGANAAKVNFPCNIGSSVNNDPSECKTFETALGTFPVNPIGFISKVFSVVLSLAGLGAIITIVYSGWRILLSRGDKEKLQAARDRLTSAIVGLLFIIFSLALLSVIGGDILKIPGFG